MNTTQHDTITEIDPRDLDPMIRRVNRGLMVKFINDDLLARAALDVRTSIVLYDGAEVFAWAVPTLPDVALLARLYASSAIRYWSKGC
jgi:hypothetical protein